MIVQWWQGVSYYFYIILTLLLNSFCDNLIVQYQKVG